MKKYEHDPLPMPGTLSARKLRKWSAPMEKRRRRGLTWRGHARVGMRPDSPRRRWPLVALAMALSALAAVSAVELRESLVAEPARPVAQAADGPGDASPAAPSPAPEADGSKPSMRMREYGGKKLRRSMAGLAWLGKSPRGRARLRLTVTVPHRWEVWLSNGPGKEAVPLGRDLMPGTASVSTAAMSFGRFLDYDFVEVYSTVRSKRRSATKLIMRVRTSELHRRFM